MADAPCSDKFTYNHGHAKLGLLKAVFSSREDG